MVDVFCSSCNKKAINLKITQFSCPRCGKHCIVRCESCKVNAVLYTCPLCSFTGPN